MRKVFTILIFIFWVFAFGSSASAATRTISDAGGNYNAATAWVEGIVPSSADDIVDQSDGTSGALTINVATTSASMTLDHYNPTSKTLTLSANYTVTGTLTIQGVTSTSSRLFITSNTLGTARTLSAGAVTASSTDFRDIAASGAGNWNLSAIDGGSGNAGGNTNITFTTAVQPWYFKATTNNGTANTYNWSENDNWYTQTNGGGSQMGAGVAPLPQDDFTFDASSFSATSDVNVDMPRMGTNIDWSASTQTTDWSLPNTRTIYGSLNTTGLNTITGANTLFFEGRGNFLYTQGTGTNDNPITIQMFGGKLTMQDAMTTTGMFNLLNGEFDANDNSITATRIVSNGTLTRILTMGNGTWTSTYTTDASIAWDMGTGSGLTLNAEGSTISFTGATSNKRFTGGNGKIYNNLTINAVADTYFQFLTYGNTFNTLTLTGPRNYQFPSATTTYVSSLVTTGTSIVASSTSASAHTLSDTTGTNAISNTTLSYSTATGGATWNAYTSNGNVDGGNNTGWNFTAPAGGGPATGMSSVIKTLIRGGLRFFGGMIFR